MTTVPPTISDFLLPRIAEDEAAADRVEFHPYVGEGVPVQLTRRVLAEVRAKRRIVELHGPRRLLNPSESEARGERVYVETCRICEHFPAQYPCATLRALATVYADHEDFREEWRAEAGR